jgi:hypothetical protein
MNGAVGCICLIRFKFCLCKGVIHTSMISFGSAPLGPGIYQYDIQIVPGRVRVCVYMRTCISGSR